MLRELKELALACAVWGLGVLAGLASLGLIGLFLYASLHRIGYPFDLEWMEGGLVDHVARLLSGKPIYAPPSVDYVPFIYNPLYYVLAAAVAKVVGLGYFALRLVSFLATLASFACLFLIVWKESRALVPSLFAPGLFAGTFALSGAWFDLARVDSTYLALCLGAWLTLRWSDGARGLVASAALLLLAFLTKQAALAMVPAWLVAVAWTHGVRKTLWFLPPFAVLVLVLVALEWRSDGWYSFYAYRVPSGFPSVPEMYLNFWKTEVFAEFTIPFVLGLFYLTNGARGAGARGFRTHAPFGVFLFAMAYAVRLHSGSFLNDKMPLHAALSALSGLALATLVREDDARRQGSRAFAYLVSPCQLGYVLYAPAPFMPTARDVAEGTRFVAAARKYRGDVLVTHHGWYSHLAGKPAYAHGMAVFDVIRTSHDFRGAQKTIRDSFQRAFATHRFAAIFTDDGLVLSDVMARYYNAVPPAYMRDPGAFVPKTGPTYRPRTLNLPRR